MENNKKGPEPSTTDQVAMTVSNASDTEVLMSETDSHQGTATTYPIMDQVASVNNLLAAFRHVKRNKGSAGVDISSISDFEERLDHYINSIKNALVNGTYSPFPVRVRMIHKPGGKLRKLGIPTVHDRVVQQAILNILQPMFDPTFSDSSFGFRPKRSAHMAVKQAAKYVESGRTFVVDIDLETFFDNAPHDHIMEGLRQKVSDVFVLKLIKRFLKAGQMNDGDLSETNEGTPQGSPLSPLLSNILLHRLDLELEKRGHKFCRYADDCNIYVGSLKAAESVLKSTTKFIENRLKLKVNKEKSAAAPCSKRKFLGFTIKVDGKIAIAKASVKKLKDKVRKVTKRNRGKSLKSIIFELRKLLLGWGNYFSIADSPTILKTLDAWIRRKLRCYRIKQRKRKYSIYTWLKTLGIPGFRAWSLAKSNNGWWKMSLNQTIHKALNNQWFANAGLVFLTVNQFKMAQRRQIGNAKQT